MSKKKQTRSQKRHRDGRIAQVENLRNQCDDCMNQIKNIDDQYVGMLLTFGAVWCKALSGTKPERNRDFSRGVLGIIIILAIVAAYFVVWLEVKIPSVINDIITLLAV